METQSISLKEVDNDSDGESSTLVGDQPHEFKNYAWVKVEVLRYASIYQKSTDIMRLTQTISLTSDGEMAPKLSQKDLMKIFNQREGKQVSSSSPASALNLGSSETEPGLVTLKRYSKNVGFVKKSNVMASTKLVSLSPELKRKCHDIIYSSNEVQAKLDVCKDFDGSVWEKCFHMIDSDLAKDVDVSKYQKIGTESAARVMLVHSFRNALLAKSIELEFQNMEKKVSKLLMEKEKHDEEKKLLGTRMADFEKQAARITDLEKALVISQNKVYDLSLETDTLRAEKNSLDIALQEEKDMHKKTKDSWIKKQAKWDEENESLKEEALAQYEAGFARALKQVKILYPRVDLSGTGLFKEIQHEHGRMRYDVGDMFSERFLHGSTEYSRFIDG
ncbi:hypothetical protein RJT34_11518 [Clitoria ternatea]|uniref:Uncharacterized protein n=1 Tax=Clitoria ternatea TaxID=43366 RepID=A0AAN9JK36_CLITE